MTKLYPLAVVLAIIGCASPCATGCYVDGGDVDANWCRIADCSSDGESDGGSCLGENVSCREDHGGCCAGLVCLAEKSCTKL